jgi:hypothetical protein
MSQFYQFNWPVPVTDGVAKAQAITKNVPLILNGSYANQTTGTVNFSQQFNIVPKITLTSTSNLSGVEFLINGYQNGVFINETLTGPNNTTVSSNNCFDVIQSIMPSVADADNIKVGVASTGYFPIILLNTAKSNVSSLSYALNMIAAGDSDKDSATYTIYLSLENTIGIGKYDDLITKGIFAEWENPSIVSQLIQSSDLAQNLLIKINPNPDVNLKAQFLQL